MAKEAPPTTGRRRQCAQTAGEPLGLSICYLHCIGRHPTPACRRCELPKCTAAFCQVCREEREPDCRTARPWRPWLAATYGTTYVSGLRSAVGRRLPAAGHRPARGEKKKQQQRKRQLTTYGEQQPMSITRAAARALTGYGRRADPTSGTANSSWTNSPRRAGAVEHVAAGQEWHGSVPTYLHRIGHLPGAGAA